MNNRIFLLLLFCMTLCQAQKKSYVEQNGYYWVDIYHYSEQIFSEVNWVNKKECIDAIAKGFKIYYIRGIFELETRIPLTNYQKYIDAKGNERYSETAHPYPYILGLTPDQVVKGLDHFYSDYKNLNVLILDAIHIVQMEITDKNEEEIDWQTRFYRANDETRLQMLRGKK